LKIVFLTEAGSNIGYGHITRCYALFQVFQAKKFEPQIIIHSDVNLNSIIPDQYITYFNWHTNHYGLKKHIKDSDILIVDSYLASPKLIQELSSYALSLVFIDDFMRLDYPKGVIINGAIGADLLNYNKNKESVYLLGAGFQPIRSEFWSCKPKQLEKAIKNLLVTVGGNDIHNILPAIINRVQNKLTEANIHVVCGNNLVMKKWIDDQSNARIKAHFNLSALQMKLLFENCDLAISAAGQTLYELASCGVPTIAFSVADNQKYNLEGWTNAGFVTNIGSCLAPDFLRTLEESIETLKSFELRENSSHCGQKTINGKGGFNTLHSIMKFHAQNNLTLREARLSDVDLIFELSNDPVVRENSFNQNVIAYENHVKWYQHKINSATTLFLVAEIGNTFAGQVRYEYENNQAIIGISIGEMFRGIGIGEKMVTDSINLLACKFPDIQEVKALVKKENPASGKMFIKSGYQLLNDTNHLEYILKI
jgi:UDP-2,4-diacetamido-2,4,6-trideoxy-beta-L-altropyranose hydrolase